MITTHINERKIRSKGLRSTCHKALLDIFGRTHKAHHIAIEDHEVGLLATYILRQSQHHRVATMDVVNHREGAISLPKVHRTDSIRRTRIHIAGADITARDGVMTAIVNTLLIDAVAIGSTGFEASNTHMVHIRDNMTSHKVLVIAGTLLGIERCAIVGSNLHPSHTTVRRGPHHGHLRIGNTHHPWATLCLHSRGISRKHSRHSHESHNS